MNSSEDDEKALSSAEHDDLLGTLKTRFEKNLDYHPGLEWDGVRVRLEANPEKPGAATARDLRPEDLELGADARRHPKPRWCPVRRPPLR